MSKFFQKDQKRSALIISSALMIGLTASLGTAASATLSETGFGVRSYNNDKPTIQGFAGLKLQQDNGGNENPPIDGEECTVEAPDRFTFSGTEDGLITFVVPEKSASSGGYENYDWFGKIDENGGEVVINTSVIISGDYSTTGQYFEEDITNYDGVLPPQPVMRGSKYYAPNNLHPSWLTSYKLMELGRVDELKGLGNIKDLESVKNYLGADKKLIGLNISYTITATHPGNNSCQPKQNPLDYPLIAPGPQ